MLEFCLPTFKSFVVTAVWNFLKPCLVACGELSVFFKGLENLSLKAGLLCAGEDASVYNLFASS